MFSSPHLGTWTEKPTSSANEEEEDEDEEEA